MRPLPLYTIPLTDRYIIKRVSEIGSCYTVTLRHGYIDNILKPGLAQDVVRQIGISIAKGPRNDRTTTELDMMKPVRNVPVAYVLGKEMMEIGWPSDLSPKAYLRSWLLWTFLRLRKISQAKVDDLGIDADKVVEVVFIKELRMLLMQEYLAIKSFQSLIHRQAHCGSMG